MPDGGGLDADGLDADGLEASALRSTLHRVNNYIAVVMATAETAIAKNDAESMRAALLRIVSESAMAADALKKTRREIDNN